MQFRPCFATRLIMTVCLCAIIAYQLGALNVRNPEERTDAAHPLLIAARARPRFGSRIAGQGSSSLLLDPVS